MKTILVTGGAGYIGSHTCIELIEKGYNVIVVDNYCNSSEKVFDRLKKITGVDILHFEVDCCNYEQFKKVFEKNHIDGVIHFAGYKAVGESVYFPMKYYTNNLISAINLVNLMEEFGVKNLVFSSSCTVYGNAIKMPITEEEPLKTINPYGHTKLVIEDILRNFYKVHSDYNIALLRYFNPIGAHKSGLIGDNPNGIPSCLVPYITQVAVGKREKLSIYGNDYNTIDGTGVRDYMHVCDLANGHVLVLNQLFEKGGLVFYNLGAGQGYSVLQVLKSMEKACGFSIPYEFKPRRAGDAEVCYASCEKAKKELGWEAKCTDLDEMCADAWNFQKNNPNGY